jgi:hypothetical protein
VDDTTRAQPKAEDISLSTINKTHRNLKKRLEVECSQLVRSIVEENASDNTEPLTFIAHRLRRESYNKPQTLGNGDSKYTAMVHIYIQLNYVPNKQIMH